MPATIVTGAGRGIGRAIADHLSSVGHTVVGADVAWPEHDDAERRAVACDVTSPGDVEALFATTEAEVGPVDHVVNCAGVLRPGSVTECSEDDWACTFAVNASGVFFVTKAALARMIGRKRGSIVTVASNAARVPRMALAAYGASKAASTMLTKCAALEGAPHGVRCNVVHPGSTDAPMLRTLWGGEDHLDETIAGDPSTFRLGIPLQRIASPMDVADAVAFLLSDEARQITMHELVVDGGATLGA